jgi:hypothetical protein
MWSTCAILLTTPLALVTSACGLAVDRSKGLALIAAFISGAFLVILVLSTFRLSPFMK